MKTKSWKRLEKKELAVSLVPRLIIILGSIPHKRQWQQRELRALCTLGDSGSKSEAVVYCLLRLFASHEFSDIFSSFQVLSGSLYNMWGNLIIGKRREKNR